MNPLQEYKRQFIIIGTFIFIFIIILAIVKNFDNAVYEFLQIDYIMAFIFLLLMYEYVDKYMNSRILYTLLCIASFISTIFQSNILIYWNGTWLNKLVNSKWYSSIIDAIIIIYIIVICLFKKGFGNYCAYGSVYSYWIMIFISLFLSRNTTGLYLYLLNRNNFFISHPIYQKKESDKEKNREYYIVQLLQSINKL